jgi:hypothetical protein
VVIPGNGDDEVAESSWTETWVLRQLEMGLDSIRCARVSSFATGSTIHDSSKSPCLFLVPFYSQGQYKKEKKQKEKIEKRGLRYI